MKAQAAMGTTTQRHHRRWGQQPSAIIGALTTEGTIMHTDHPTPTDDAVVSVEEAAILARFARRARKASRAILTTGTFVVL
jgi:hypothetical protein